MTMPRLFKVVDPLQPSTSGRHTQCQTDWTKCVLCQKDIPEELRCPADAKRSIKGVGYKTLADNLFGFSKIDSLPKTIDVTRLDDADGVEATFQRNRAKWHDPCRLEFNSTQRVRAEKRKTPCKDIQDVPKKFTRQSVDKKPQPKDKCFFCDEQDSNDDTLHEASTFELDAHVRKCALQLGDKPLLSKLSAGDLIAQEAKYHTKCLVSLYNKVRDADAKTAEPDPDRMNHAVALAELVTYIEEARTDALVAPVFVLADLAALYTTLMEQLGTIMTGRVHSTKLKNRILRYFPDLEEHKQGRDVLLAFNQDLGSALQKACGQDADDDAIHLARAANIVRRDMLKIKTAFSGSFDTYCQEDAVPHTLTGLVGMVLYGSNIRDQPNHLCIPAPTLAISQLLVFNFGARRRENTTDPIKHSHHQETPVPVYLGLLMHTKTRKRDLVDILFHLGLSISYDRVLSISTDLGKIYAIISRKKMQFVPLS